MNCNICILVISLASFVFPGTVTADSYYSMPHNLKFYENDPGYDQTKPSAWCDKYEWCVEQKNSLSTAAQRAIDAARQQEEMVADRTRQAEANHQTATFESTRPRVPFELKDRTLGCLRVPVDGALRDACVLLENTIEDIYDILDSCSRGNFQFEGTCEMAESNLEMAYEQAEVLDMVIKASSGNYDN